MAWLLGQPLFEMCWVYMAIAQIAQDPPLCQTDKHEKKFFQTILASPYTPGQTWGKKCPKQSCKPLHPPALSGNAHIWNQHISRRGSPNLL